jgi:hypothetical protein
VVLPHRDDRRPSKRLPDTARSGTSDFQPPAYLDEYFDTGPNGSNSRPERPPTGQHGPDCGRGWRSLVLSSRSVMVVNKSGRRDSWLSGPKARSQTAWTDGSLMSS